MGINFDDLIKPYSKGGTERNPATRTLGTIASKLIISYRLPVEIVGAAVFKVFYKMAYEGLEFKGNGKYGSKGKELFSCIKAQAVSMVENKAHDDVINSIAMMTACVKKDCPQRTKQLVKMTRWQRVKRFMLKPRGWWMM